MKCPACGHQNRPGATFCGNCGAPLSDKVTCASCGTTNPRDQRFCDACGAQLQAAAATPDPRAYTPPHLAAKILKDRAKIEGERRTVTALFADAVGSTPMAEMLGEEQIYKLMQGCIARMLDAVHRYEGTVVQFRGDGVLALFGAPIAHEDSARRAVAAALDMQESLEEYADEVRVRHRIECKFRVGLNTGPVVVGSIGDDLSMDFTALGDTVNLAARMEQAAEPGTVYLTENTYRAVRDYFEFEALGGLIVKGKAQPVQAHRAVRHKPELTRFEAAAQRGLTPFVGRAQDLETLKSYFERSLRGAGQVMFVSGEAGIGKSRLLLEFRRSLPSRARWLEGHCISYGRSISYLPIIDILKRAFGIEEGDDDARIIARVEEGTGGWEQSSHATIPYIRHLLSVDPGDPAIVPMDPRERRAGIFDGLRSLLLEERKNRPVVVVVEDLHWIDELSEEALASLVDVVGSAGVLLILTYRPGYNHSLGERTYYNRLALTHLAPEESVKVCARVLQADALPEAVERLVVAKAEGNPFFIEEVTKALVETGVLERSDGSYVLRRPLEKIVVPDTIQEVILSRIDRLERQAKEAIQLASVIGREFTVRLLRRISDLEAKLEDALAELKILELIYEKTYYPELSYMFKHALTHDVAYSTLLTEKRKALHRIVATAVEELYADRLTEQHEALAHHYFLAEVWDKALDYLGKAGDKAAAAFANQEALDFYARALEVCERLGDPVRPLKAEISMKRGFVSVTVGDFATARADFEALLSLTQALSERTLEGKSLVLVGLCLLFEHRFDEAERTLRAALDIGREGFDDVRLFADLWLAELLLVINRHAEAEPLLAELEELAPVVDDPATRGWWGGLGAIVKHWRGRYDESVEHRERWREASEKAPEAMTRLFSTWIEGLARGARGEFQRAIEIVREVIEDGERVGDVQARARAMNTMGWLHNEIECFDLADEWNRQAVEAARAIGYPDPEIESNALLNAGDTHLALGNLEAAEEAFRAVEGVVRNPRPEDVWMLWRYSQHLFHSYGQLKLARGDLEGARALADECLALAESSESRRNIAKARRLRGQILAAQGRRDEAEREIRLALDVAREIGNPIQEWKSLAALGDVRRGWGRGQEARSAYTEALAVINRVAARLTEELRERFLGSPAVRAIQSSLGA